MVNLVLGIVVIAILSVIVVAWLMIQRRRRELHNESIAQLDAFTKALNALHSSEYIPTTEREEWEQLHQPTIAFAAGTDVSSHLSEPAASQYRKLRAMLLDTSGTVRTLNDAFVQKRLAEESVSFDQVEKYPLTERQRRAIVTDEINTLVVAGAGTGKTSTMVGKVDYLTRRGLARPGEILVLAYGAKAAEELRERLSRFRLAGGVETSTFHALGLRIIGSVEGQKPSLSIFATDKLALGRLISNTILDYLDDQEFALNLIRLFSDLLDEEEDEITSGEISEIAHLRSLGRRDLTNTKLKSRQEVSIANWLTLHGIRWEYERPYPFNTATPWQRPYQPDFYLPDHDIYLEHFGIDRHNQTAKHVDTKSYLEAMEWKRQLHRTRDTTLIETFTWMFNDNSWTHELRRLLMLHRVPIRTISADEAKELLAESSKPLSDFVKLIDQFLSLFKSGNFHREQVTNAATTERDQVFLAVFFRILDAYEQELAASSSIDFNDMINLARRYVHSGEFKCPYRYILIDEFQDISANRLGLIEELRSQQSHSRTFMVGDDWQSIYRFTGSDVGIITHLDVHLGYTERVDLDIAFRYQQPLLDVTSRFVMKNPAQLKKQLRAHSSPTTDLPICVVFNNDQNSTQATAQALELVTSEIANSSIVAGDRSKRTAMMIGRYSFNRPENFAQLAQRLLKTNIELTYSTAHGSKGKEADFVILVGLESGEYGFPSNLSDDHVMRMVLTEGDAFPYGEERRLFYVALTRTRSRTFLVVPHDNASEFVTEDLLGEDLAQYVEVIGETSERHRCPRCKGKTVKRRQGEHGTWWACTNYPICLGKLPTCSVCREGAMVESDGGRQCSGCGHFEATCPRCGEGVLVSRRNRKTGNEFWACSAWNDGKGCDYTQNYRPHKTPFATDPRGPRSPIAL